MHIKYVKNLYSIIICPNLKISIKIYKQKVIEEKKPQHNN